LLQTSFPAIDAGTENHENDTKILQAAQSTHVIWIELGQLLKLEDLILNGRNRLRSFRRKHDFQQQQQQEANKYPTRASP
jgi:hypothetical protein